MNLASEPTNIDENKERLQESLYGFPVREKDARLLKDPSQRSFDIKRLWSRTKEIIHLDSLGYKGSEIAKMLGVHPVTVSNALNSTLGKEAQLAIRGERDEEFEQLREEVLDLTRKSLDVYREIFNSPNESARLRKETADTVVLELSGLRTPTKVQSLTGHVTLTPEQLEDLKQRGKEQARASGRLIELNELGGAS